jgi:cell surface protein SprA
MSSEKGQRPWDPANFTIGGSYSETFSRNPNTTRQLEQYSNAYGQYEFSWQPTPVEPFANIDKLKSSKHLDWLTDFGFYYAPKLISYKTNFTRNYYEQVVRDFDNPDVDIPPTFAKDFMWNNDFDFAWDLTKNIKLTLTTSNRSLIEENEGGVNSQLYPDEFQQWKDTVWASLRELGSPQDYNQRFTASWNVPFNKMPVFNWITANFKYDGNYQWVNGTEVIANTATSKGMWQVDGKFNFETLYNKSSYLKDVNRKFASTRSTQRKKPVKNYDKTLTLKKGEAVEVRHRLNDKKARVKATANGKPYKLKYKVVDANTIN